jgi:hypothetical protein
VDACAGDYVVVPVRAPHTFSNPSGSEACFLNTFTPAFCINYFKLLSALVPPGERIHREASVQAMASFATLPVPEMGPPAEQKERRCDVGCFRARMESGACLSALRPLRNMKFRRK